MPHGSHQMSHPSPGIIVFLFTDIEGSTQRWEKHPEQMRLDLAQHDALLRSSIEANEGAVFKTVGDAFHAVFPRAPQAVQAALAASARYAAPGGRFPRAWRCAWRFTQETPRSGRETTSARRSTGWRGS
jgi:class 3 adenylate cyclase